MPRERRNTMSDQNEKQTPEREERAAGSPGSVFELVDCTSDEIYVSMGLFLSLEDALDQIKDLKEPPTDDPQEFFCMEVRERQIGKLRRRDNGKKVATIRWVEAYIDAKNEWVWHKLTICPPNAEHERDS